MEHRDLSEMPGCFDKAFFIILGCIILLLGCAIIAPFLPSDFLTNLLNKIPFK